MKLKTVTASPLSYLDNMKLTRFHWLLLLGVTLAQVLDGYDFQITSFALPGIGKDFHLGPAQLGAIPSTSNFGLLVGAVVFATLADRFGRRILFQIVLFTFALGSFLSAIAPDYNFLLVARFIAGLGIGAEFPVAFALLAEYAPKAYRARFIPLGPFMYGIGWIVAGVASIWIIIPLGWRAAYWLGILPALIIIYIRLLLPESVRYLLGRGRVEDANRIIQRIAATAGDQLDLVSAQADAEKTMKKEARLPLAPYVVTIAVMGLMIFFINITTFGISAWLPSIFIAHGQTLLHSFQYTMIIFAATPCAMVLGSYLQDRTSERRFALAALAWVGAVFFFGFGLAFLFGLPIQIVVAAQLMSSLCSGGTVAIYYTLGAELFPTAIRSQALGYANATGRLGAIVGPLLLGVLVQARLPISTILLIYGAPLVLAGLVALFMRGSTRMKSLEETATVITGDLARISSQPPTAEP